MLIDKFIITVPLTSGLIGAAVGALASGVTGHYMDNQQQEFERDLQAERDAHTLSIERLKDGTPKLSLDSEVSFDVGRSDIKPTFWASLDKLAAVKKNITVRWSM
jgi:outer membrane protein OmpA-like peptidoglycan-associated protein